MVDRFDEEVRHVFLRDAEFDDGALAGEREQLRRQVDAVRRPQEQQHGGADAVGVELQRDFFVGRVVALVGHDFEVVEAEFAAVEAFADDREEVAAFDFVAGFVGHVVGQAVLAFFGGLQLNVGEAFGVRGEAPVFDFGFDRLALGRWAVGDFQQPQFAGAFDGFAVEAAGGEVGFDRVADAVVAAIDPGVHLERLAGDEHIAGADDCAPRLVDDFGFDRVAVVLVGMKVFGDRGIDLD